ncbi:MAG: diadenylate cyclase, partial [Patescibacteria group bacterium]|nr:diadenylate cyclase [Patescibacteria group bacterium]
MDGNYTGKIAGLTSQIQYFWQSLDFFKSPFAILDIILVALILYLGYLLLKETRALRILYGIIILAIIFFIGKFFQLTALNYVLQYLFTMIIVAIPIVFQPELRAFLEKVGRAQIIGDFASLKRKEIAQVIKEIIGSVDVLSHNRVGALIVLTQRTGLREYIETGTKLNATVTQDLILSIFTPKTPLHDGAVITGNNNRA